MRLSLRLRTAVGIPAAALATVLLPPAAAHAEPAAPAANAPLVPKSPANAAATWMASKLTDGTNAKGDQGLTADVVMGLASTDTGGDVQKKATDWLAANAKAYIESKGPGTVFAGGVAKLVLVAAIEHRDPKDFGGQDLVKTLTERMGADGRFTDKHPSGDGSQQFTQSLAVMALQRTGGVAPKAVDFLARSQCPNGGYPLYFGAAPDKCSSHIDSTGLAVQALLGSGRTAAAKPALNWLEKKQLPDGGFPDSFLGGGAKGNSNSTALAVQALAVGGRTEAAAKGVAWLRSRQVNCSAPRKDWGAVGYTEPKADGMALRATAQVVPALAGKSLAQVDAADSAAALEDIVCVQDGGTPGGGDNGGTGNGGTDGGGSDGGTSGGDGGNGGDGGTSGGGDGGGDNGGSGSDGGSSGGGDDDASGGTGDGGAGDDGAGDDGAGGADNTPAPQTGGGDSATTGGGGGFDVQPVGNPDGSLASTGTSSLPMAAGAGALLAVGTTAVLVTRRRRTV
ncbi:terpene cyclase/mutase family protein [Streptomyces sp. PmtG]